MLDFNPNGALLLAFAITASVREIILIYVGHL